RQTAVDGRDAVADVVGGRVDVAVDVELDAYLGALVLAVGLDLEDAFDAGDGVLDDLRDFRLDDRGRGTAVGGRDRDDGSVDVGILAYREPLERHEPEDHEHQAQDGREDRPANGQPGDAHRSARVAGA